MSSKGMSSMFLMVLVKNDSNFRCRYWLIRDVLIQTTHIFKIVAFHLTRIIFFNNKIALFTMSKSRNSVFFWGFFQEKVGGIDAKLRNLVVNTWFIAIIQAYQITHKSWKYGEAHVHIHGEPGPKVETSAVYNKFFVEEKK